MTALANEEGTNGGVEFRTKFSADIDLIFAWFDNVALMQEQKVIFDLLLFTECLKKRLTIDIALWSDHGP